MALSVEAPDEDADEFFFFPPFLPFLTPFFFLPFVPLLTLDYAFSSLVNLSYSSLPVQWKMQNIMPIRATQPA
jgi:hypothetical protein